MHYNDLKRLVIFVSVVQSGSFTGAAKQLNLPRSSVSDHISKLEKSLNFRLLQRTTRKLSLTAEGKAVFELSQKISELADEINSLKFVGKASGRVSVSITTDMAQKWLVPLLVGFHNKYPDISVQICIDEFASDLIGENIDLALRVTSPNNQSSSVGRILSKEATCFYASPNYLNQNGSVSLKNIDAHKWVLLTQMIQKNGIEITHGKDQHVIKPRYFNETDSPEILIQMLEQDFGIGILIPSTAMESVKMESLLRCYRNTIV